MKYIVCEKPGELVLKEKSNPVRKKGEALVKIQQIGICGTDIHAYGGNQAFFTYPRILGHEIAAEIVAVDKNESGLQKGDRVVVMPYLSCGTCFSCKNGKPNCCSNIRVLGVHTDGGMQEYLSLPTGVLLKANQLNYNQMAIVEPLAIGAHAVRRAGIKAGEDVVVTGCGPIGIGIMKMAQRKGANVIAIDISEERLAFVKEHIGINHIIKANSNTVERLLKITNGNLAAAVFDASGYKEAIEKGPEYMAYGGRFILVGLSKGDICFNHPAIHAKESTVLCSRNATLEDFQTVIDIIEDFPTDAYITHQISFTGLIDKFDDLIKSGSGVIKAVLKF